MMKMIGRARYISNNDHLSQPRGDCYCRHPEAVGAYQIGPKRWAVNTCGGKISEDRARQRLNSEWGFEASRIKLLGVPYYDATDGNLLRLPGAAYCPCAQV